MHEPVEPVDVTRYDMRRRTVIYTSARPGTIVVSLSTIALQQYRPEN